MTERTSSIEWSFRADDALDALRMRQVVRSFLEAEGDPTHSDLAGAVLVFGELVGNVVRHAPGQISVRIDWRDGEAPRLTVEDSGPGLRDVPSLPPDHDPWRE
ncbi:MAG: ATP-binding protein, partial [Candidatus Eremiobacteraeota bacterium]|nr:ATP-binding protein [Candidatus Eremiobacteraeota bacterium]